MKSRFVVAQMEQNGDPEINLENARKAVAEAVEYYHADFIVFPECFMSLYPAGTPLRHSLRAPRLWMDRLQRK